MIELIVAIGIFVTVISVAAALLVSGIQGHRKALAIQTVQDNARFLLGFIAKELRMAEVQSSTYNALSITRHDGEVVTYTFYDGKIYRADSSTDGPISSEEVVVTGQFFASGVGSGDYQQPRVTINLKVEIPSGKKEERTKIRIQTTLSPRNLDI